MCCRRRLPGRIFEHPPSSASRDWQKVFLGGAIYGLIVYWLGGVFLFAAGSLLGSNGSYRRARHVLAYAAAPLVLLLLFVWPVRLAVYGDDLFRSGGDDSGAGDTVFEYRWRSPSGSGRSRCWSSGRAQCTVGQRGEPSRPWCWWWKNRGHFTSSRCWGSRRFASGSRPTRSRRFRARSARAPPRASRTCAPRRGRCQRGRRRVGLERVADLPREVRVALDEARQVALGQAEQVVVDEHLAVAVRAGADADRRHPQPARDLVGNRAGTASRTTAKQPAASSACASATSALRGGGRLPCVLKPPSIVADCGVRPTWPITGMPASTIDRTRASVGAGALELDRVRARLLEEARRSARRPRRTPGTSRRAGRRSTIGRRAPRATARVRNNISSIVAGTSCPRGRARPSPPYRRRGSGRRRRPRRACAGRVVRGDHDDLLAAALHPASSGSASLPAGGALIRFSFESTLSIRRVSPMRTAAASTRAGRRARARRSRRRGRPRSSRAWSASRVASARGRARACSRSAGERKRCGRTARGRRRRAPSAPRGSRRRDGGPHERAEDRGLLRVLLAEVRARGADEVEQLQQIVATPRKCPGRCSPSSMRRARRPRPTSGSRAGRSPRPSGRKRRRRRRLRPARGPVPRRGGSGPDPRPQRTALG